MNPVQVFERLLSVNKSAATFLLVGIAVFAAVAIVGTFQIDRDTAFLTAAYIVGFSAFVYVLTLIVNHPMLKLVLGWFVTLFFICVVLVVSVSAVMPDRSPFAPTYCLVRFWEPCSAVAVRISSVSTPAITTSAAPTENGQEAVQKSDYQVFVQFAGLLQRQNVMAMMQGVAQQGWDVQGTDRGGERTGAAAGYNEVRYNEADREAAAALAKAVQDSGIVTEPIKVKQMPRGVLPAKTLEVWISKT
jgi:hypothetical protein